MAIRTSRREPPVTPAVQDGRPPAAPRSHGARPVLLLALAHSGTRWALREHLSQQGFVVHPVGDGRAALEWLERRSADVVISDLLLPGTRIAVPHVLRRRWRASCPKLIGLTGGAESCDELQRALSFDLVLRSGTPTAVLTKAVHRLLAGDRH
jgi:CheY-like chemotaxis protein